MFQTAHKVKKGTKPSARVQNGPNGPKVQNGPNHPERSRMKNMVQTVQDDKYGPNSPKWFDMVQNDPNSPKRSKMV